MGRKELPAGWPGVPLTGDLHVSEMPGFLPLPLLRRAETAANALRLNGQVKDCACMLAGHNDSLLERTHGLVQRL
jgi:hypothetical protein